MPIDQTLRGLALEIDASVDPSPEAQPLLEYRFIDLASTQTILARIKGIPRTRLAEASWLLKRARGRIPRLRGCLSTIKATWASEPKIRSPDWKSAAT